MIRDVNIVPLKRIPDDRGCIMHMLRSDDPHFKGFGEIYFSTIYPGVVKGWHRHKTMWLSYACIVGRIKLCLIDSRMGPSNEASMDLVIGQENYSLVQIPPGVWNGFVSVGPEPAIVANCASIPHDPAEIERSDPFCWPRMHLLQEVEPFTGWTPRSR